MKTIIIVTFITILACQTFAQNADEIRKAACQKYKDESGNDEASYDEDTIKSKRELVESKNEGKTYLRDYMIEKTTDENDLISNIVSEIIPWAVFFVISLLGMLSYCYCCCCTKCACCCNKKTPLTKVDLLWPLIGSIAFCVYVLFSGSFGAAAGSVFLEDYFMMKCAMLSFLADFNTGNFENEGQIFIGLNGLYDRLGEYQGAFVEAAQSTFNPDGQENAWISSEYDDITDANQNQWNPSAYGAGTTDEYIYTNTPTLTSGTADPSSTYYNKLDQKGWRFFTTSFDQIVAGALFTMRESLVATNEQGLAIADESFSEALGDGQESISDLADTINTSATDFNDSTVDVDDLIPTINSVFAAYFAVTIVFTLVGILFSVFFIFKTSNPLRILLNFVWFIFMLWAVIGFLFATIFTAVSSLGFQMCGIMNNVLNDYEEFKALDVISGDSANYIKRCKSEYGGDGLILVELGIDEQLDSMVELNQNMAQSISDSTENKDDLDQIQAHIEDAVEQFNDHFIPNHNFQNTNEDGFINEYDNLNVGASAAWIAEKDATTNIHLTNLRTFETAVNDYIDNIDAYIVSLETFSDDNGAILEDAQSLVTDEVNCLFLGTNIDDINDSLCVGLIPAIHTMTEIIKVHCFGLLFASFFLVFAQHRIPKYAKDLKGLNAVDQEKDMATGGVVAGEGAAADQQFNNNQ